MTSLPREVTTSCTEAHLLSVPLHLPLTREGGSSMHSGPTQPHFPCSSQQHTGLWSDSAALRLRHQTTFLKKHVISRGREEASRFTHKALFHRE